MEVAWKLDWDWCGTGVKLAKLGGTGVELAELAQAGAELAWNLLADWRGTCVETRVELASN